MKIVNMKNLKFMLVALAFISCSIIVSSCGSKSASEKEKMEKADKSGPEYTSAYVCPMHCEGSGSASEGKCPVCGMDYVVNKDMESDGHDHDGEDHSH